MGFFYFCRMVTIQFLEKVYQDVVSKSYYDVPITHLAFYYKEIYSKELNVKCSSCLIDAHLSIKKYYRENIGKFDVENAEYEKHKKYKLKLALIEFQKSEHFEICEWIKNRING